nr:YfhO family protein [uncultured Ligilactobacillus sp.]
MNSFKNQKKLNYIISFIFPILLFICILFLTHVYPFGNNTVVTGDMKHQYISLMTYFKENIFHPRNFLYSYQIGLGSGFFAVLAYYLINPLNIVTLFIPSSYMPIFFMINLLVNIGLIGLTTYTFLTNSEYLNQKKINHKNLIAIILGTCFAFSSFFANYQQCTMWVNAIILLPIVLLGLDRILYGNGKTLLYWISLGCLLLINWYIGIIVTIFLFISTLTWVIKQILSKRINETIKKGTKVLIYSIFSVGIGTIAMLPSYLAQESVNQEKFQISFEQIYHIHSFFSALLNGNVDPQSPLIFCGVGVVLFTILYFFSNQYSLKSRLISLVYILFLILTTNVKFFYMMWHAFSMPNGFVHRESFLITFVFICFAYQGAAILSNKNKSIFIVLASILIAAVMMFSNYHYHNFDISTLIFELIVLVTITLLCLFISKKNLIIYILLSCVCVIDIFAYNYKIEKNEFSQVPMDAYQYSVSSFDKAIKKVKDKDSTFYRMGSSAEITPNDPLLFNYNGVQAYISQQPTSLTDYISALGYYQKHSWIRWNTFNNGSTFAINSLLGIKYYFEANKNLLNNTQKINSMPTSNTKLDVPNIKKIGKTSNIKIFENQSAFPLVFNINRKATDINYVYNPESNLFEYYNQLLNSISKTKREYYKNLTINTPEIKENDYVYNTIVSKTGNVYLYLGHLQAQELVDLTIIVNGKNLGTYGGNNAWGGNGVLYLGRYNKNDQIKIEIKNAKMINQPNQLFVSVEDVNAVKQLQQEAVKKNIKNIHVNGNKINFNTNKGFDGGILALSIPYEKGWKAKVDGKQIKLQKALGDLTAINLKKGKHHVELTYVTPGLKLGMIISGISLIILIALELVKKVKRR